MRGLVPGEPAVCVPARLRVSGGTHAQSRGEEPAATVAADGRRLEES